MYLKCIPTLFLLLYVPRGLSENDKFQACTVGRTDCSEIQPSIQAVKYLKSSYGKCKYIIGNLVICDLSRLENGTDPDLSFLETIEEVSGYVYISRNSVKTIPLKSLRIIRGESSYKFGDNNGSLIVTRNFNRNESLETIDFRNLIAIQNHNVIVKDNPHLCNFAFTVQWEELFLETSQQHYIPDRRSNSISQRDCNINRETSTETYKSCDGTCTMFNGRGYCWGPGPELCQKMIKCHNNPSQYCVDGPMSNEVCSEECLGGCESSPNNCRACRHVRNNGKCMAQCPPQYIFSPMYKRTVLNPDFKYTYYYECVDDCPAPFLKSKSYCVIECDLKTETVINGTCVACKPPGCPQHCTAQMLFDIPGRFILDKEALLRLKNCSHFTGTLYLNKQSFTPGNSLIRSPIDDLSLLWNMESLQAIVGRIYFDFHDTPPEITNLTFLRNLRSLVYETGESYSTAALQLMNGDNIEMLGFRSLKSVHGRVYIANMSKLCYLDALETIVRITTARIPSKEECANRGAVCNSECLPSVGCWGPGANMCAHCCNLQAGDVCVSQCTDLPGFYEIADSKSRQRRPQNTTHPFCLTLPLDQVQTLDVNNAYLRFSKRPAKQCAPCHPECANTCYGPEATQCKGGCRHYQNGDECVAVCPTDTYTEPTTRRCLPCHEVCRPSYPTPIPLCSGAGSFLGIGGCTTCSTVIQNTTTKRFDCLSEACPPQHYEESPRLIELARRESLAISEATESRGRDFINVCRPCHPYCSVCSANGTHKPNCRECLHWWFKDECVKECPPAETYFEATTTTESLVLTTNTVNGTSGSTEASSNAGDSDQKYCLLCHEECVLGCTGPGPGDCHKCRNYKFMLDNEGEKFVCRSTCPEDQFRVLHSMCLTPEQYAKMSGRGARELRDRILIAVAVVIIVLISFTTLLLVLCLRRRAEVEKTREKLFMAFTNLDTEEMESLLRNQSSIREPNMGRLEMISADELEYDSTATPLGSGAFGVVYRGVWRLSKAALVKRGCHGTHKFDVAIKVIQNEYPITPNTTNPSSPKANGDLRSPEEEARRAAARTNLDELLQEAKVMASVEHQHCLPLIGICLTRERHCLVTMFLEMGSLDRYVKEHQADLSSLTLLMWAEQIADGMNYLEMRGIIHRDLAARNVLLQRRDLVQITDFGLAKMLDRRDVDSVVVRAGRVPIRWLAIETLQDSVYSHKTDVWAYGVTLWEIFTYGKRPYEDVETKDIKDHVMKGGRLTQPDICTLDVYMVMVKCWMEDYESRPTFAELTRTFSNFCKTPGRYLYIQGDEYAIHYPNTSTFSPSNSVDTHELRPLITPRGVPDGSVSSRINGTLDGKKTTNSASRFVDYVSNPPEEFRPFDSGEEPSESDALLPVRSSGPSIWPLRTRGQGVGAPDSIRSGGVPSIQGRDGQKAPLLGGRDDSWLSEAPSSPNWRMPRFAAIQNGSTEQTATATIDAPTSPSFNVPSKPHFWTNDGYLEPKPNLSQSRKQIPTTEPSKPTLVEDYLIPKTAPKPTEQPMNKGMAVCNMEYFSQPDTAPSQEGYPNLTDSNEDERKTND